MVVWSSKEGRAPVRPGVDFSALFATDKESREQLGAGIKWVQVTLQSGAQLPPYGASCIVGISSLGISFGDDDGQPECLSERVWRAYFVPWSMVCGIAFATET